MDFIKPYPVVGPVLPPPKQDPSGHPVRPYPIGGPVLPRPDPEFGPPWHFPVDPLPPNPGLGRMEMTPEMMDHMNFRMADANFDGTLSRDEFKRSTGPASKEDEARFKRFDQNGDGKIDSKEYSVGRMWERLVENAKNSFLPPFHRFYDQFINNK